MSAITAGREPEAVLLRARLRDRDCGRVLDLGCGDGRLMRLLAGVCPCYSQIIAVDSDRDALDEARRSVLPPRVKLLRAGGEALPFADRSFETATIGDALHHVRDPLRVLHELRRVVAPGGLVVISETVRLAGTPAQATAVRLHHFKARVDARCGVRHRRTLSHSELRRLVGRVFSGDEREAYLAAGPAVEPAEQQAATHARRLREYLEALRNDARYPVLCAAGAKLAGRVAATGYTPAPRSVMFVRISSAVRRHEGSPYGNT